MTDGHVSKKYGTVFHSSRKAPKAADRIEHTSREQYGGHEKTYLAVTHVLVSGETDRGAVGEHGTVVVRTLRGERIHGGGLGGSASVVLILDGVLAPSVQDTHQDGLLLGDHGVGSEFHRGLKVCWCS
jgi:hypothetical protein